MSTAAATAVRLPIDRVFPNPDQPRKRFNADALAELAASIERNGLMQPISVQPRGDRFMIVAGERRYRAHLLAKLTEIDALVRPMGDEERDILAIIENLQRVDITPLEEGRAFQRMLDTGMSVEDLSERLGLRQPWRITERTALLKLTPSYLDLLEKGHLTASQATELARLQPHDQDALFRLIDAGKCDTYQKLRAASDALLLASSQGGFFEEKKVSENEQKMLTAFEAKIEQVLRLVTGGFKDGEIVALKKINPHRAATVAEQLALIVKHLKLIERDIVRVAAQGEIRG